MEELLERLQNLMVKRAGFRKSHPRLRLSRKEISRVSEQTMRRLRAKSTFEKWFSNALGTVHARYKDLNGTVQTTLDKYADILGSTTHPVGYTITYSEEATGALRCLEGEVATFRKRVKSLLRTVYMSDSKAWDHFVDFPDMIMFRT
jgi:hypothetical protein